MSAGGQTMAGPAVNGPVGSGPVADVRPDAGHAGPSARPDVSVVIVTYNARTHVDACLRALPAAFPRHTFEVLLVDNASSDGTVPAARTTFPRARVFEPAENLGFARGNNLAIRAARGDKVLVLNPDTVAQPESLSRLAEVLDRDTGVGIVAPLLLNTDGTDQGTARSFPTPAAAILGRRSLLTRWWPGNPWSARYLTGLHRHGDGAFEVDWASGACLMVSMEAVECAGAFDERFFLYWEDADWCRRMKQAGWRVVCEPAARVLHDEGAQRYRRPRQVWIFHQSAYRYYSKHHLTGGSRVLRPVAWAALSCRAVAVCVLPRRRPGGAERP
jgi:N-acetylglucosaminyl-diphospho-decaprenol L-rhamnosyltransferase